MGKNEFVEPSELDTDTLRQEKKYKKYLKNKTVAIISCAPTVVGSKQREFLETFDIIVRVNHASYIPKHFEKDIGSRTNVLYHTLHRDPDWVTGLIDVFNPDTYDILIKNKLEWVCHPNLFKQNSLGLADRIKIAKQDALRDFQIKVNKNNVNLYAVSRNTIDVLKEKMEIVSKKPSAGLIAIYDLLMYDITKLYITGFTFYKIPKGYTTAYYPECGLGKGIAGGRVISKHNVRKELLFFKKLCEQDKRITCDKKLNELIGR